MATYKWYLLPTGDDSGVNLKIPLLTIVTVHQTELDDRNSTPKDIKDNPYALLGISQTASLNEVKEAYKKLAYRYHPDKQRDKSPDEIAEAEHMFKEISVAYQEILASHREQKENDLAETPESTLPSVQPENMQLGYHSTDENTNFYDTYLRIKNDSTTFDFSALKNSGPGNLSVDFMNKDEINERVQKAEQKYKDILHVVTEKAFLWKAEKENCAPIYLFGSIHKSTIDKEDVFGDAVDNLVDKIDVVYTEINLSRPAFNMANFLGKKISIPTDPSLASSSETSLDAFVANKAAAQGKRSKHLENKLAREILAEGTDRDIESISEKDLKDYSDNYLTHVSPSAAELNDIGNSISKRNLFWMNDILSSSSDQQKSTLVVCGAAHNAGKYGLPNLLASEGYSLNPIMKVAPTPKSTLLQEAVTGGVSQSFFKPSQEEAPEETKAIVTHSNQMKE